jgi:hypothetical protein
MLVNIIRVNSKGRHVRSRFPLHLTGGLLEAPYLTPKTDKGTVVNLYFWEGAKDSWADEWPNHKLSSLVAQQHHLLSDPQEHFPTQWTSW